MTNSKKSTEITNGIRKRFEDGTSNFANAKCYGYSRSESGDLVINEDEASVVRFIFDTYLAGASLGKVAKLLCQKGVLSPGAKPTWGRSALDHLLSNEKYIGGVVLQKTVSQNGKQVKNTGTSSQFQIKNHHPAIIPQELFQAVQNEKQQRSNIVQTKEGPQRADTRYHSPQVLDDFSL